MTLNIKDNKQVIFMYRFTITFFSDVLQTGSYLISNSLISNYLNSNFSFEVAVNLFLNIDLLKPLITA